MDSHEIRDRQCFPPLGYQGMERFEFKLSMRVKDNERLMFQN